MKFFVPEEPTRRKRRIDNGRQGAGRPVKGLMCVPWYWKPLSPADTPRTIVQNRFVVLVLEIRSCIK